MCSRAIIEWTLYQLMPVRNWVQGWGSLVGGRAMGRAAAVGIAAPQHAAAAAGVERHDVAVALVADAHVAAVARTGEMAAAHALHAELEPQLGRHVAPARVARLPDVLVGEGHRLEDGVLAEPLGDLGLDLADPDHEPVVLRRPAHAQQLDGGHGRRAVAGGEGRSGALEVARPGLEAPEAREQPLAEPRLAGSRARQAVVEDVREPHEEDVVHDGDLAREVLGQLERQLPAPLLDGHLRPRLGADADGLEAVLAQGAAEHLARADGAGRPALGAERRRSPGSSRGR